jgi:F0F1-type ATP synthase assembly protein I
MNNNPRSSPDKSKRDLLRYAGLASQLLVYIAIAVAGGIQVDRWLYIFPLFTILFPILTLTAFFYKLFKETSGSK